jgi:phosphoribosylanthranilate isomerase
LKVKICGITNIEDALLCESLGANALGFIFYEKSKRYISREAACGIVKSISPFTMKIGIFVNKSYKYVNKIAAETGMNAVQLHNDIPPEELEKFSLPVIQSFRVDDQFDYSILKKYQDTKRLIYFLLDTYSNSEFGGTGKKFNWELIPERFKSRIILAGGISIENVDEIFKTIKPAGIDLSSSVESEPGKKDKAKLQAFFKKLNELRGTQC